MKTADPSGTITRLLSEVRAGSPAAGEALFSRVYDELRVLARSKIRNHGRGRNSLEPTALVNAACERVLARAELSAVNRRHFFFVLGRAMHHVLIEQARSEGAKKRSANRQVDVTDFPQMPARMSEAALIDLREALEELRNRDAVAAEVATLRFLCGRTLDETASVLGSTPAAVRRDWDYARAWLRARLASGDSGPS